MTHGSLFSGIGGFDLAAEWMGWKNAFHCEKNEFGRKTLNHYWPFTTSYDDITTTNFIPWRGKIDILSGGFPCQPFSSAGKRKGTEDERHLWPEMLRAIREIQPRFIVGENVLGLVSWNEGMVFHQVCTDLENEGYQVQPVILPAAGVNAPHQRYRVWFVAYCNNRFSLLQKKEVQSRRNTPICLSTSDTYRNRPQGRKKQQGKISTNRTNWDQFPTQPPICGGNDGLPSKLDGITFPRWRNESIKAYGNAIVPQLAFQIFQAIENSISK